MSAHDTGCVVLKCGENVPARQRGAKGKKKNHPAVYFSSRPTDSEGRTSAGVCWQERRPSTTRRTQRPGVWEPTMLDGMCKKTSRCGTQLPCHRGMRVKREMEILGAGQHCAAGER